MKYTDALSNKSQFPNQIDYDGLKMKVVIAPKLEDDFYEICGGLSRYEL